MELGVDEAYKAVMKPTEGTILTVARVAGERAREALELGSDPRPGVGRRLHGRR